jgi:arabinogalactan endo-1,4-beta-galactosidase
LDHGGNYTDQGVKTNPYKIFKDRGTNIVRLRLWHDPTWTKEVYGGSGTQLYNDIKDVEKSIELAKQFGLQVLLDFHYSDVWADPGTQKVPEAWKNIKSIEVLSDSVYKYTAKVLNYLNSKSLLPEYVQIGNETNCGMFFTEAEVGFPTCNGCNGQWSNLRSVINSGLRAVRDVSLHSGNDIKSILHVADPKNIDWWFTNVTNGGEVKNFDIIGFSYYPIWHNTVPVSQLSESVSAFKSKFNKDVMILETAYPWTTTGNDSYNNIFGGQTPISGFPFSNQGQLDMMKSITQELIDGGGIGIFYWEPAWISSNMKDLWGTGSSWENNTFFDYNGEINLGAQFMMHTYTH